jgi:glycerophosphoryl diester phosphodiesterase
MELPQLVAHRGYARRFPENSIEGLQAALEAGACFVELDVQLTADAVPVLFHDHDLDRTAGVPGRITELTLEQIDRIEINESRRLGDAFSGVRVPTLAGAVALLRTRPEIGAFVEVKPASLARFGIDLVWQRVAADLRPARAQCTPISYSAELLLRARRSGWSRVGWVLSEWSGRSRAAAAGLGADYLVCNHRRIPASVDRLWPGPWRWVVYEIDTAGQALDFAARGADLIETMAIAELLQDLELSRRGCRG